MPTYDYVCKKCGNKFERFQSIAARPLRKCPDCGKNALKRLIGAGAGIIFKGSGFYETDYRSDSYKKAEEKDKKAPAATEKKTDKKTETKTKDSKTNNTKTNKNSSPPSPPNSSATSTGST